MTAIENLSTLISTGLPDNVSDQTTEKWRSTIESVFGERYRADSPHDKRVVLTTSEEYIPFAGLLPVNSPQSGVYGGFCLVWFPKKQDEVSPAKTLLAFGCGIGGISPDEAILARPGHARYLQALKKYIYDKTKVICWSKHDPTNLIDQIPDIIKDQFSDFKSVFGKYGSVLHFICEVPQDKEKALFITKAFFDFYAWERKWRVLTAVQREFNDLYKGIQQRVFPFIPEDDVYSLLKTRYFVILQGPPGTGKTRLANRILLEKFQRNGTTIQFHPATTYENFVIGIQPNIKKDELAFSIENGYLVEAIRAAQNDKKDYLLLIDEINRADLGKVLGEAIALFEYQEIANGESRKLSLPFKNLETKELTYPNNLFILGTMNSADRSIAILDLAVRRRFAFVDIWPQQAVVDKQDLPLASDAYSYLQEIFIQYSSSENLVLLPGHSYFLARTNIELLQRFQYELIPLLEEYIRDGRVAAFETQIQGYIDWLKIKVSEN